MNGVEDVGGGVNGVEDVGGGVNGVEDVCGGVNGVEDVGVCRPDVGGTTVVVVAAPGLQTQCGVNPFILDSMRPRL